MTRQCRSALQTSHAVFENTCCTFFQISKKAFLNGYLTDISKKNVQQKFSVPYFEMSSQLRFGFTLIFKSLFFAICFIAMVIKLSMALNSL